MIIFAKYNINNCEIPVQTHRKHLGVVIDQKLSFNEYIDYVYNKSVKKWSYINRLCSYASPNVLLMLYKTYMYILPIIEYNNTCLTLNLTQNKKIESIQRSITKQICHKMNLNEYNYTQRLEALNISSLECRRNVRTLKILFKCIHDFNGVPNHWKDFYSILRNDRNGRIIDKPKTRNNFCDKNFFIHSIQLFNSLPIDIRNENNLNLFLTKCQHFYNNF